MSDYIKIFNTKSEQDRFLSSSNYKEPHISCTANGGNLRYNQSFIGILVGTNVSNNAYIKSTQWDAFLERKAIRAYSDAACTELIENSDFEVTTIGIQEYCASLEIDAYEVPGFDDFGVEDGIIVYPEEVEASEFILIGYLESDSSKKAYSSEEPITGAQVYSDAEGTTSAISGHYICVYGNVVGFDVSNGLIIQTEEEQIEEVCEAYYFKIVKDDDTIPTPSNITYEYDEEYTIQLDQQFTVDECWNYFQIKVYFNNVLTINKSIAATDSKLITIVRSGSGYDLVTSEYIPEVPAEEEPDEPVDEQETTEDFKVRVKLDSDSNIPTPRYINCEDGYGEEGEDFALNTVVDTWVHRPSCNSLYFNAEINGTRFSSSIRYFDLAKYPTVNDITIYDDGDGSYYFELDYKPVTINVQLAPGVPAPSFLTYYSTEEETNFSINTNCTIPVFRTFDLYATISGTTFHSEFSYNELQSYPTVNYIYIYEKANDSGYYFDITEVEDPGEPEEPLPEEPVAEEPLPYQMIGYLSTNSSKKAYVSIDDTSDLYSINPIIYVYSDEELETYADDGHYIGDYGNVLSFDVTNGLISNIQTEDLAEEEPAEEEPEEVMPHDGMDPDAGGGEDIVEEDETTTDPPIPEEMEEP